jgi:hypothetical protein
VSTIQIFRLASGIVDLVSRAMYSAIISPIPWPVSPAPAIKYVCWSTDFFVFGAAAMIPASVVAATPWMSSAIVTRKGQTSCVSRCIGRCMDKQSG